MYIAPDDAKTDVILAAVTTVVGVSVRALVTGLPLYPRTPLLTALLDIVWILALTALVPVLLVRYRRDGAAAFGFAGGAGAWRSGVLLAVPVVALGVLSAAVARRPEIMLLGRSATGGAAGAPVDAALAVARVAAYTLGTTVLIGFLAVRARDGFPRSPELSVTQLVRTVGLGLVIAATIGGLVRAVGGGSLALVGLHVLGLAGLLLITDRLIPAGARTQRTTVVAPVVVVVLAQVFAGGGIISGGLLTGLYRGALGGGLAVTIAAASTTRRGTALAVLAILAAHWWPTCLSPLAFVPGTC